jgi:hypothetical protein
MGKYVTISTKEIQPSQNFLKEKTLEYILDCIEHGNTGALPPTPLARADQAGRYIAIDGHNLIAVYDYLGRTCQIYVADSPTDKLPNDDGKQDGVEARNKDLLDKFESSLADSQRLLS